MTHFPCLLLVHSKLYRSSLYGNGVKIFLNKFVKVKRINLKKTGNSSTDGILIWQKNMMLL